MPTYEYACRDCGHHLEVVQSFTDDPLDTCERCGGSLRKVFSAAGIIFKGSGYYVTDTRADRRRTSGAGRDGGSSSDDGGSTSKDTGGTSTKDGGGSSSSDSSSGTTSSGTTSSSDAKSA